MMLVSIKPGAPSAVRVYSCTYRTRRTVVDVKFTRTPNAEEVAELQARPVEFLKITDDAGAA